MSSPASGTFYEILGIDPNASPEEIKKAYKKRALQTHPDRLPQGHSAADKQVAEEEFRKVNNAYEVLMNPDNRKAYDLYGVWPPPEELPQRPRGEPSHSREPFFSGFHDPFVRSGPFSSHHAQFAFHDPFELFNAIFAELDHDLIDPFSSRSPFGQNPFGGVFAQPTVFPSAFSRPPMHSSSLLGRGFGGMLNFPGSTNARSYSYSSSSSGSMGRGGEGPQWVSERRIQRTINGVTQTMHEKRDSQGNVHVRKVYPDGREQYTINGVDQSAQPRGVEGSPPQGALPAPYVQSTATTIPVRSSSMREDYVPSRPSIRDHQWDGLQDTPYVPPAATSTYSLPRKEKHRESRDYPSRHSSRSHRDNNGERRSQQYGHDPASASLHVPSSSRGAMYGEVPESHHESTDKKHWWNRH
ncbi:hypothetical protein M422DRAFT_24233 [Sphaerobolus stellatus SS14]|nr:hypothetical protein M422DRAFT_24233 [Sphaerobolus stellatus SS14]